MESEPYERNRIELLIESLDPTGEIQAATRAAKTKSTSSSENSHSESTRSHPQLDTIDRAKRIKRAIAYLEKIPPGIQGQNGSKPTFFAARALVWGFALESSDALNLLEMHYSPRCEPPWSREELDHKVRDAMEKPFGKARGWLLFERAPRKGVQDFEVFDNSHPDSLASAPTSATPLASPGSAAPVPPGPPTSLDVATLFPELPGRDPDHSRRLAELFLMGYCNKNKLTLRLWNDVFYVWKSYYWKERKTNPVKRDVVNFVEKEFQRIYKFELQQFQANPNAIKPPKQRDATTKLNANVFQHVQAICGLSDDIPAPSWINPDLECPVNPLDVIATPSGLVKINEYITGRADTIIPNTPDFFNHNAIDYAVSFDAPEPARWLQFLDEVWTHDSDSKALLQEWFGYLLTSDTSLQKMLLLLGAPGCGKGTILRVIKHAIGAGNCCSPSFSSLSEPRGLASLLEKSVALIGDARITKNTDTGILTERLLSISGEDSVPVDRKWHPEISVKLNTRIVISTNKIPRLEDTSGAFQRRFSILRFTRKFTDVADSNLEEKLKVELPGIFNWAIEGLARLRERGRFTVPKSSETASRLMSDLGSNLKSFLQEECVIGPECEVERRAVFERWKEWCEENNVKDVGTANQFGVSLFEALPSLETFRRRIAGKHVWHYRGVGMKTEYEREPSRLDQDLFDES